MDTPGAAADPNGVVMLRDPAQRSTHGRPVTAYPVELAQHLLANADRIARSGAVKSPWHYLAAELDAALVAHKPGQTNEVRWAMLQLAREEVAGQRALALAECRTCGK